MTPEEELSRAGEAEQMLRSAIFQQARVNIEGQLAEARRIVPIRDTDMHTRLVLMEQLWGNLVAYFEQIAQTGKMAQVQLAEKQRQQSLIERGIAMFRTSGRNAI
jgi:hypothetical protein